MDAKVDTKFLQLGSLNEANKAAGPAGREVDEYGLFYKVTNYTSEAVLKSGLARNVADSFEERKVPSTKKRGDFVKKRFAKYANYAPFFTAKKAVSYTHLTLPTILRV